jgi:hypothetical protein
VYAKLIALAVATAMGLGGCSWIFVQPLPPNYDAGSNIINCTADQTAPVIDTLLVVSHIVGILYLASNSNGQNQDQVKGLVGLDAISLFLWGASAIYGYRHTNACSDAQREASASPSHHLGVRHQAYRPTPPTAGAPLATPPPAAPGDPQKPTVATPQLPLAPQQGDDEKPSRHSPSPPKPWTLPPED